MKSARMAIFASGTGSNAQAIIDYFAGNKSITIPCLISNKEECGAIELARKAQIEVRVFANNEIEDGKLLERFLVEKNIDVIILAGFLRKIPRNITSCFPDRIINIHPAILPDFGGKGMYGKHVHQAVLEAKKKQSGITIHLVNEKYDEGNYLAQFYTPILENDTVQSLEARIRSLELNYFPFVIEGYIKSIK